jgi:hypothetical protein
MQCHAQSHFRSLGPTRRSALSLALLACLCVLLVNILFVVPAGAAAAPADISIQGSGVQPQLGFACCDQGIDKMQALFADPAAVAALRDLRAQVAVAIADFSPERAKVVRMLNQQQIPVIAAVMLQTKDGPYFNADDVAEAPAQIAAFEKWTQDNGLHWAAVGIDIEPNFSELAALKNHPWRLVTTLVPDALDSKRIGRAQEAYSSLIRQIQSQGYPVETYTLPYGPVEQMVHTTVLDRLLGTVDVKGDENDLMIYTSYARPVGSAIILDLGPGAQGILVGITDGPPPSGSGFGPLDWDEFSSDLIVASHFAHHLGVYNLEGCVQQGYLPRLKTMDWGRTVVIPAASVSRAKRHVMAFAIALWVLAHLLYFIAATFLLAIWRIWRIRRHRLVLSD